MKLKCDSCGERVEWNDKMCKVKGMYVNRSMVIGKSGLQMKHFWNERRFDATYWCLSCWKKDREKKDLPRLRDFDLMVELGMIAQTKADRRETYGTKRR